MKNAESVCHNYKIIMTETGKSRNNNLSILFRTMEWRIRRTTKIDGKKSCSEEQDWGAKRDGTGMRTL